MKFSEHMYNGALLHINNLQKDIILPHIYDKLEYSQNLGNLK